MNSLLSLLNNKTVLIAVFGALVLIGILITFGVLPGRRSATPVPATLEFWNLEDTDEVWRDIFERFRKQFPHLTVSYRRFDEASYEDFLVNRLAEGKGPDVFVLKNSWIAKHRDKIAPLPETGEYSARDFKRDFADIAVEDLINENNQILGLPLFVDTPALFYNKDIFNTAGIAIPPNDWTDVIRKSQILTKVAPTGDIIRSGMALGGYRNIENAFETLNSLILQNGDSILNKNGTPSLGQQAAEAVSFYASFADPTKQNYSWTSRMRNSLDSFAEGVTAMVIGMSRDIGRIGARNPHLNFSILPFPQPRDAETRMVYGAYFFPTVSKLSQNQEAAWQFLRFITSREAADLYLRKTSRSPARRDLISAGAPQEQLYVFYNQALIARTWRVPDEKLTRNLFQDMIESVVAKSSTPSQGVDRLREKLRLINF